jgi:hypothetical protein
VKLTRRGKVIVGLLVAVAVYLVSTKVWWIEGQGYCFGSVDKCYKIEEGVK